MSLKRQIKRIIKKANAILIVTREGGTYTLVPAKVNKEKTKVLAIYGVAEDDTPLEFTKQSCETLGFDFGAVPGSGGEGLIATRGDVGKSRFEIYRDIIETINDLAEKKSNE